MCIRIVALYAETDSKLFWIKKTIVEVTKHLILILFENRMFAQLLTMLTQCMSAQSTTTRARCLYLGVFTYISNGNNFNGQTKLEVTIFAKTEKKNYNGPMKRVLNKKHFCKKFIAEIQIPQRNRNYFQRINEHSQDLYNCVFRLRAV